MDLEQLRHVATLAELSLSPEEEPGLAADITRILAYVAELEAVDTAGVVPMTHPLGAPLPHREDHVVPGLSHEDALRGAPETEHGGFVVPTFVG
jgi:aspartyl-tRNA(Asn)/glutamyl-tRNA(Gln) amidotransferase subunit C